MSSILQKIENKNNIRHLHKEPHAFNAAKKNEHRNASAGKLLQTYSKSNGSSARSIIYCELL